MKTVSNNLPQIILFLAVIFITPSHARKNYTRSHCSHPVNREHKKYNQARAFLDGQKYINKIYKKNDARLSKLPILLQGQSRDPIDVALPVVAMANVYNTLRTHNARR